jgi:serine/threonine-protein kinase PknK
MTGRHHVISEFLAENVLDTLEPSMLDFLLSTSITERICGDLASALSGVPDGQAMLEQVEERDHTTTDVPAAQKEWRCRHNRARVNRCR